MLAVVRAGVGTAEHVMRLTIYVTDKREYLNDLRSVASVIARGWANTSAMALVEVKGLLDPAAKVEIEATAVL